jgi:hypothetical protein
VPVHAIIAQCCVQRTSRSEGVLHVQAKSQNDSEARNGATPVFGNSQQQSKGSISGSCAEECAVFKGLQGTRVVLTSLDDPPVRGSE